MNNIRIGMRVWAYVDGTKEYGNIKSIEMIGKRYGSIEVKFENITDPKWMHVSYLHEA